LRLPANIQFFLSGSWFMTRSLREVFFNNTAGYGGLLRESNGNFIWGFYGVAAQQNILFAEIMAILHGLQLCWDSGYRKVVIKHILCESNACADVLAKMGAVSNSHRIW
ncbi:ribonuclease H protein, partial [Trifolium medium]|nr:ribonuclease H protein [Trifolium medium]